MNFQFTLNPSKNSNAAIIKIIYWLVFFCSSEFHRTVKERVHRYFKENNIVSHFLYL